MTAFAHTPLDAMWQPDARLARALATAFGQGSAESQSGILGVEQPVYGITQGRPIEGVGTGGVGRRRKR